MLLHPVNHEAWIEVNSRAYLKWGHYPEIDGKIKLSIVRALAIANGTVKSVAIGLDKESSAKGIDVLRSLVTTLTIFS